jgi:hypothetical protein
MCVTVRGLWSVDKSARLTFYTAIFCTVVPSSDVQQIEGERCLRAYANYLKTCTGADELGF